MIDECLKSKRGTHKIVFTGIQTNSATTGSSLLQFTITITMFGEQITPIKPRDEFIQHNGASFFTRTWSPPEGITPILDVLYMHGFSDHVGNADIWAEDFSSKGVNFFAFDERGFGETAHGKERAVTNDYYVYDDLEFFVEYVQAKKDYTGKLIIIGHSMGGSIALNYGIRGKHRKELAGIVACSPEIKFHPFCGPNRFLSSILPILSKIIPNVQIGSGIDPRLVSTHDKVRAQGIYDDELSCMLTTPKFLYHMLRRGLKLLDYSYAKDLEPTVPVLIQQGTGDIVCSIEASRKFVKHGFKNVLMLEYPDAHHCLYMETEEYAKQGFSDLWDFLNDPQSFLKNNKSQDSDSDLAKDGIY